MSYLSDSDYSFIYSRVPRICVDLIIRSKSGVLLTKRKEDPFLGLWHTPGGRIQFKESVKEAIKRISKQELGVECTPIKMVGIAELLDEQQYGEDRHSITIYYECEPDSYIEGCYFTDLPQNTIPQHYKFLRDNL